MHYASRAFGTAMVAVAALSLAACADSARTLGTAGAVPAPPPAVEPRSQSAPPPEVPFAEGASLTVQDVLQRARARNLTREVFAASRAAVEAEIVQARAWANPELEISGGRSRPLDGGSSSTIYGVDVRQRFELPGKRSARIDAAQAGAAVIAQEIAVDGLELEAAVREACLTLARAESVLKQRQKSLETSEQMSQAVDHRVAAKEADAAELARAKLDLATARIAVDQAARQAGAGRAAVQVWAGGSLPQIFYIADALPAEIAPIDLATAQAIAAEHNPRIAVLKAQITARLAELARENRAWHPDLTVGVFSGREADSSNNGLSLGIELPLWNRNQGGIAVANAQVQQAQAQWRLEQQIVARAVALAWQQYESQRQAAGPLLGEAKAAADAAITTKMSAFSAGEASLIEVLEARRASQAIDEIALEAKLNVAEAWLALGQAMGSFTTTTTTLPVGAQP